MNRRQQNQAIKDFESLKRLVGVLDSRVRDVLQRGTFDSGQRRDHGKNAKLSPELRGTLEHADPTGDIAIKEEMADRVGRAIEAMARNIGDSLNIAKWVLDSVPNTTSESVLRHIPDCEACGRPVFGKVVAGYDRECYDRKRQMGITDRVAFKRARLDELVDDEAEETS